MSQGPAPAPSVPGMPEPGSGGCGTGRAAPAPRPLQHLPSHKLQHLLLCSCLLHAQVEHGRIQPGPAAGTGRPPGPAARPEHREPPGARRAAGRGHGPAALPPRGTAGGQEGTALLQETSHPLGTSFQQPEPVLAQLSVLRVGLSLPHPWDTGRRSCCICAVGSESCPLPFPLVVAGSRCVHLAVPNKNPKDNPSHLPLLLPLTKGWRLWFQFLPHIHVRGWCT